MSEIQLALALDPTRRTAARRHNGGRARRHTQYHHPDLTLRTEAGDRTAMRTLAESYYAGREGAEQDFVKAAEWFRRLARQGDPRAQTSLGLMYARGYGVAKNLAEAHRW